MVTNLPLDSLLLQARTDGSAGTPVIVVGIIAVLIVAVLALHFWFGRRRRPLVEEYIASHHPDRQLVGLRWPPMRLWIRNGRFDSWFKAESAAGVPTWYRVRRGRVDAFD